MKFWKLLLTLLTASIGCQAFAQDYYFEYTSLSHQVYEEIIDLKLDKARTTLKDQKALEPYNLSTLHLDNYLDFFELFIHEDFDRFKELEKNKSIRINRLKKHLRDEDPFKKFAIAEIELQWALTRSKFDQLFKSGREVYHAYHLLKDNQKEHPDFVYNNKSLSIIHSLIETITIPGIFKKLFGISGSIDLGMAEIDHVIKHAELNDFIFEEEADAIKAFILFYQKNDQASALAHIEKSSLNPEKSLLSNFLVAKLYQRSGHNEKALMVLGSKPISSEYENFYYLDFMKGVSLLRKLDPSSKELIESYIKHFEGRHYIKEAYQKLAWSEVVFQEDIPNYKYYISKVGSEGYDLLDDDKQAYKEYKSKNIPDPILLKVRLLADGGYYSKAYNLLSKNAYRYHTNGTYGLEFSYRLARVCQYLKNYPEAIKYFNSTINNGLDDDSYFACNSALQLGLIYESIIEFEKAEKYFKLCLEMSPSDYKRSLHQKAKSGLDRVKK